MSLSKINITSRGYGMIGYKNLNKVMIDSLKKFKSLTAIPDESTSFPTGSFECGSPCFHSQYSSGWKPASYKGSAFNIWFDSIGKIGTTPGSDGKALKMKDYENKMPNLTIQENQQNEGYQQVSFQADWQISEVAGSPRRTLKRLISEDNFFTLATRDKKSRSLNTRSGNDLVHLKGEWSGKIDLGKGDDHLIAGGSKTELQIDFGSGMDRFEYRWSPGISTGKNIITDFDREQDEVDLGYSNQYEVEFTQQITKGGYLLKQPDSEWSLLVRGIPKIDDINVGILPEFITTIT